MAKTEGTAPKTTDHHLTYGGCIILKGALTQNTPGQPFWYKGDESKLPYAVDVVESYLCDKADPQPEKGETQEAYDTRTKPILNEVVTIPLTQREREACQTAVTFLLKQGMLPVNRHVVTLMRELEIESK